MGAQNQDGEQARDQGRQRRARIIGQGPDQSARGHLGAYAMQGVVDAVGVRLGRRRLRSDIDRRSRRPVRRIIVERSGVLDFRLLGRVAAHIDARAGGGPYDHGRHHPPAAPRLVGLHPGADHGDDRGVNGFGITGLGQGLPDRVRPCVERLPFGAVARHVVGRELTAIDIAQRLKVVREVRLRSGGDMHGDSLGLEHGGDGARPTHPQVRQDLRIEQYGREFPEQIRLGAPARLAITVRADESTASIPAGDTPLVEPLSDAPVLKPMPVKRRLGEFGLFGLVGQPGQQPSLFEGHPPGLQGHKGRRRQSGQGGQPLDVDLGVAEGPGDHRHGQLRFQHPADSGDDVGDMDRHGGVGEQGGGGLTGGIGLDTDGDGVVRVDLAGIQQDTQGEAAAAAVQRHPGLLLPAPPGPDGEALQLTGGLQCGGQGRDVVIRWLVEPQILARDADVAETHGALVTIRDHSWSRIKDKVGHEGSPAGLRGPSPSLRHPSAPSLLSFGRSDGHLVPVPERRVGNLYSGHDTEGRNATSKPHRRPFAGRSAVGRDQQAAHGRRWCPASEVVGGRQGPAWKLEAIHRGQGRHDPLPHEHLPGRRGQTNRGTGRNLTDHLARQPDTRGYKAVRIEIGHLNRRQAIRSITDPRDKGRTGGSGRAIDRNRCLRMESQAQSTADALDGAKTQVAICGIADLDGTAAGPKI